MPRVEGRRRQPARLRRPRSRDRLNHPIQGNREIGGIGALALAAQVPADVEWNGIGVGIEGQTRRRPVDDRLRVEVTGRRNLPHQSRADADQQLLGALLERVALSFDCDLWMVLLDGETRWLRKKLKVAGVEAAYERR